MQSAGFQQIQQSLRGMENGTIYQRNISAKRISLTISESRSPCGFNIFLVFLLEKLIRAISFSVKFFFTKPLWFSPKHFILEKGRNPKLQCFLIFFFIVNENFFTLPISSISSSSLTWTPSWRGVLFLQCLVLSLGDFNF